MRTAPASHTRADRSLEGRRLLIVEDDRSLRQMLVWELTEHGYRVRAAGSCAAARDAARRERFDLALLDLELPDGSGCDLAVELTESLPGLRIVLFSAAHSSVTDHDLPASVVASLTKPVAVGRLHAVLRAFC